MIYLDSSALVKLLVLESGSDLVWQVIGNESVATSRITWVEARAALARRERESPEHAQIWDRARSELARLWPYMRVMEVTQMIAVFAGDYAETLALRGYDAVQLASASAGEKASAASWTFMSFDRRLNRAARVMGLAVPPGLPV